MKAKFSLFTIFIWILIPGLFICIEGCKKFIDVPPPKNSLNADNVFESDVTAAAVMTQQYVEIQSALPKDGDLTGLSLYPGLSADELVMFDPAQDLYQYYYYGTLTSNIHDGNHFWNIIYRHIVATNTILEGLQKATTLTPVVKDRLTGEAKFLRAFCYFSLVNLYGDVPLPLTTDYKANAILPRSDTAIVYQQILKDLSEAAELLPDTYAAGDIKTDNASNERVRPNKWAAKAMLARVYLYNKNDESAEQLSTEIIEHNALYNLTSLDSVFLKNSVEAIWQMQPVHSETGNTMDGAWYKLPPGGPDGGHPVYLNNNLVNAFEDGDARAEHWMNYVTLSGNRYYYPFKYKLGFEQAELKEYTMVLRLAEQYLIRAEARMHLNNISGAVDDINVIRERARGANPGDLPAIPANISATELEKVLVQERRVELFTEWGHRWFDLKRTGKATEILVPLKGLTWQSTDELYPIPQYEINKNPSLAGHQNPGYN